LELPLAEQLLVARLLVAQREQVREPELEQAPVQVPEPVALLLGAAPPGQFVQHLEAQIQ
jgi:hypothetical protein